MDRAPVQLPPETWVLERACVGEPNAKVWDPGCALRRRTGRNGVVRWLLLLIVDASFLLVILGEGCSNPLNLHPSLSLRPPLRPPCPPASSARFVGPAAVGPNWPKTRPGSRYRLLGARWGPSDAWKPPNPWGVTSDRCPQIRNLGRPAQDTTVFPFWAVLVAPLWVQIGPKRIPAAGMGC